MMSIDAVLPASGGIGIFVSGTVVVSPGTGASRVGCGVGVGAADAPVLPAAVAAVVVVGVGVGDGGAAVVAAATAEVDAVGPAPGPPQAVGTMTRITAIASRRSPVRSIMVRLPRGVWRENTPSASWPPERSAGRTLAEVGRAVRLEPRVERAGVLAEGLGERRVPLDAAADGLAPRAQR